eukprot:760443_1
MIFHQFLSFMTACRTTTTPFDPALMTYDRLLFCLINQGYQKQWFVLRICLLLFVIVIVFAAAYPATIVACISSGDTVFHFPFLMTPVIRKFLESMIHSKVKSIYVDRIAVNV